VSQFVSQSHQARQIAESFGADAERYDRARPRYPEALMDRIVAASPGRDVLDVGCGTGIVARQLLAAGCTVLGVDPDARMANLAQRYGIQVDVATIEAWDPAGRKFDAVVAGQTWHWVDPVAGAAKAGQVLRPGGLLAAFWNSGQAPTDLARSLDEINRELMPELPLSSSAMSAADPYGAMCVKAADGLRQAGGFGEPERWRFEWQHRYTRDAWLDVLPTQGFHAQLPADRLAELLRRVGAAIDDAGGSFTMSFTTVAIVASRTLD
jgi:SAM-dependent methyltransferase